MSETYHQGPLTSGKSGIDSTSADKGYVVLTKTVLLDFVAEAGGGDDNVDATIVIPTNSQILAIYPDTLVAWDSVTSASLTIGTAAGGTQILGATDVKSNGRETTAPTAAQLAVWDDVGSSGTLHVRVAQSGNTTQGQARVTVVYAQKD